jgi:hypothetical protein
VLICSVGSAAIHHSTIRLKITVRINKLEFDFLFGFCFGCFPCRVARPARCPASHLAVTLTVAAARAGAADGASANGRPFPNLYRQFRNCHDVRNNSKKDTNGAKTDRNQWRLSTS